MPIKGASGGGQVHAASADGQPEPKPKAKAKGRGKSRSQAPKKDGGGSAAAGSGKGGGGGSAAASKGNGRGQANKEEERAITRKRDDNNKGPCFWHYTPEGCRHGADCPFSHNIQLTDKEKKLVVKMAARIDRSRSRSQSRDGRPKSEIPCRFIEQGKVCRFGDKCDFKH